MTDAELQAALASITAATPAEAQPSAGLPAQAAAAVPSPAPGALAAPAPSPAPPATPSASTPDVTGGEFPTDPNAGDVGKTALAAAVGGAGEAIWQTKDFLTPGGPPAEADKSGVRRWFEGVNRTATKDSTINSIVSGIAQFGVGMLGAGKIVAGARLLAPAAVAAAEGVTVGGLNAVSEAKGAAVMAAAFAPHSANVANLAENIPIVGPSLFGWLASSPDDSAAMGRLKNALTGIGVDAALQGVLFAAGKVYRALAAGDHAAVETATADLQAAQAELQALPGHTTIEINPATPSAGAPPLTDHMAAFEANQARVAGPPPAKVGEITLGAETHDILQADVPSGPMVANSISPDPGAWVSFPVNGQSVKGRVVGSPLGTPQVTIQGEDGLYYRSRWDQVADTAPGTIRAPGEAPVSPATAPVALEATPGAPPTPRDQAVTVEAPGVPAGPTEDQARLAAAREGSMGGPAGSPALSVAPGAPAAKITPVVKVVTPEAAQAIIERTRGDLDAIDKAGSLQGALEEGHNFAGGAGIPWQKLSLPGEVDDFVATVADQLKAELDAAKGGDVLHDATVNQRVQAAATYFNAEPSALIGRLQQAGSDAANTTANMEAAYVISNRMFQEAHALAQRLGDGIFTGFPSMDAAMLEFQRQVTLASSMFSSGQSIVANAGRTLRRMRPEFAIPEGLTQSIQDIGGDKLAALFRATMGNPKKLAMAANRTFLQKAMSELGFMVQNNLLWGITILKKIASDAYLIPARPLERAIGSTIQQGLGALHVPGIIDEGAANIRAEALKQFTYMGSSVVDSFKGAMRAAQTSEGVLDAGHAAYGSEVLAAPGTGVVPAQSTDRLLGVINAPQGGWRPNDSLTNMAYNAYYAALRPALALPTRAIVAADEMAKQMTYRSKVQAAAAMEAGQRGLEGDAFTAFVKGKLDDSLDQAGHVNVKLPYAKAAMEEARVATFAQDLQPGVYGGKEVSAWVARNPLARLIFPFTKTPLNIMRYSANLTPGLNLLQSEYRAMISGARGAEAQAQALGQMAIGTVALPAIAYGALNLTGGGPQEPKVRAEKMATGWRPYSQMIEGADGTTRYLPFGGLEPAGFIFGIVADIHDYLAMGGDPSKAEAPITALGINLMKLAVEKMPLIKGAAQLLEGLVNPSSKLAPEVGSIADMAIPASSALRVWVNQDPYLRETRGIVDKLMANLPGLSATLPAKYDGLGQPVTSRANPIGSMPADPVEREIARLASLGYAVEPPPATYKHVDLRDITMVDGRNAYEVYQQRAAQPTPGSKSLHDNIAVQITKPAYQRAPDGDGFTPGTKMAILLKVADLYRAKVGEGLMADKNVRDAVLAERLRVNNAYTMMRGQQENPQGAANAAGSTLRDTLGKIGGAFGQAIGTGTTPPPAPAPAGR